jgi:DNA-binding transcriptional LysR family regulator
LAIQLDKLRCFYQVANAGGLRKAADQLGLAASAMSRHIALLEKDLGVRLFDRQGSGMNLTPAGRLYLDYARDVFRGEARVRAELSALAGLHTGSVTVHATEGFATELLTDSIIAFRRSHPGILFNLVVTGVDTVLDAVQAGTADIGIGRLHYTVAGVVSAIQVDAPMLVVLAPGHHLAGQASISLEQLLREPLALSPRNFGIRRVIEAACQERGLRLSPAVTTNSIAAMKAFARKGAVLTVLSRLSVMQEVQRGELVAVPLADTCSADSPVDVCVLGDRLLPQAVKEFLQQLRADFGALDA